MTFQLQFVFINKVVNQNFYAKGSAVPLLQISSLRIGNCACIIALFLLFMSAKYLNHFLVFSSYACSATPLPLRGLNSSKAMYSFNPSLGSISCI